MKSRNNRASVEGKYKRPTITRKRPAEEQPPAEALAQEPGWKSRQVYCPRCGKKEWMIQRATLTWAGAVCRCAAHGVSMRVLQVKFISDAPPEGKD